MHIVRLLYEAPSQPILKKNELVLYSRKQAAWLHPELQRRSKNPIDECWDLNLCLGWKLRGNDRSPPKKKNSLACSFCSLSLSHTHTQGPKFHLMRCKGWWIDAGRCDVETGTCPCNMTTWPIRTCDIREVSPTSNLFRDRIAGGIAAGMVQPTLMRMSMRHGRNVEL